MCVLMVQYVAVTLFIALTFFSSGGGTIPTVCQEGVSLQQLAGGCRGGHDRSRPMLLPRRDQESEGDAHSVPELPGAGEGGFQAARDTG